MFHDISSLSLKKSIVKCSVLVVRLFNTLKCHFGQGQLI